MVSFRLQRVWNAAKVGTLCGLLAAGAASTGSVEASDAKLDELIQRIEKLEQDKQALEHRLESVEKTGAVTAPDDPRIERFASFQKDPAPIPDVSAGASPPNRATLDAGDTPETAEKLAKQGKDISALQKALKGITDKASKKTYPNVTINGAFQTDAVWVHQDASSLEEFGRIEDGADFRRARLSAKGSVTDNVNYFFQTDVGTAAIGRPTITDIWAEQTDVPYLGNVRVGQWKQPFSLEVVSSYRYTTFMERSSMFQAFTPFRRLGVGFYDHNKDETMTWAVSGFRSGQDQYGGTYTNNQGYGTAERVTMLPYWEYNGEEYLHLGLGHYFNAPPNQKTIFRSYPEIFVGAQANGDIGSSGQAIPGVLHGIPLFVSTGTIGVNCYNVFGGELLYVEGPLSFQSEAMLNVVDQAHGKGTAYLPGAYATLGYFLTGEHRPYDRKAGAIDRVIPFHNVKFCGDNGNGCGWGAWEVAARLSYLDLNDNGIAGGTLTDTTLGLNWFLNPYVKLVFNWVHAMPNSPVFARSQTDFFGTRAQLDF